MRHGLKILGIALLAALGAMAIVASAAQAAGEWLYEGKTFAEKGIAEKAFTGTIGGGDLLLTTGGLQIGCTGGTLSGIAKIKGQGSVEILLSGCTVLGSGKTCTIRETLGGTIGAIKLTANLELLLHKGEHYLLLDGLAPDLKFSLFVVEGALCLIIPVSPFSFTLKGSLVVKLPTALTSLNEQTTETIDELSGLFPNDGLLFGAEKLHQTPGVKGTLKLTDGKPWGAH